MNFYDFLIENNIDLSSFGWLIVVVIFGIYFISWFLPRLCISLSLFLLTLFGFKTDLEVDKFTWVTNDYIYRKVENLYDELGFCIKSPFYNIKVKNYKKRHKL